MNIGKLPKYLLSKLISEPTNGQGEPIEAEKSALPENEGFEAESMDVIFVCTGNTCRSPMAEGLAKRAAIAVGCVQYRFVSRGLSVAGDAVSGNSVTAMREKGIDISDISPSQLTGGDVCGAYLILTMTASHKRFILERYRDVPEISEKVFTLYEYAFGSNRSVSDPFGQDLRAYRMCADEIEECVTAVIEKILSV